MMLKGRAIGLLLGILGQLELTTIAGKTARDWVLLGFSSYVGIHLILYRPVAIFQASRRIFSTLAVWLFGGQVTSTEQASGGGGKSKASKGHKPTAGPEGSTLMAFSPYVIPLYTVLACVGAWLLTRWVDRMWLDVPVSLLVGITIALHWLMTADELQQQRDRWHIETYLLAVGLVFVLTLLVAGACLPWAFPEFSFLRALSDGFSGTQAIYTTMVQQLFF